MLLLEVECNCQQDYCADAKTNIQHFPTPKKMSFADRNSGYKYTARYFKLSEEYYAACQIYVKSFFAAFLLTKQIVAP